MTAGNETPDESPFVTPYPHYDVLQKWDSPSFNDATRRALTQRLTEVPRRRFFDAERYTRLRAVVDCVLPQPERSEAERIPVEAWIDAQLEANQGSGTRYVGTPTQREAWRRGLDALEAEAHARHGSGFADLSPEQQTALLKAVDNGAVDQAHWQGVHAQRFFREILLKDAVKIYYAHPAAWSEMGFGGPAAPRGYVRLGPDDRDPWEAAEERPPQPVRGLP
ncbi:gluconate 2-dehydrogenase subunit 3 family protein [Mangrovibrevibacter kandeliae]|uniref:gluconate 2-dehydrogenase subunit 3 family protein n=1 Tax=Mangrovibrevibacter kandeliae TaxID=2968473 RepID=UPI002117ABFC|nr:gluconate 2-dehydrogenase subunit 3 family protein [Aurantimonas sp. CSK15Z-1]MCQ8781980.1 gluconate 2-dehydrogenase subunit 3 family protein [Aurantimonas sp. CSK15Z-1]